MNDQYTAVVKKEADWWIGWIEEEEKTVSGPISP